MRSLKPAQIVAHRETSAFKKRKAPDRRAIYRPRAET